MILSKPLTFIISKTHQQNLGLFKIKDNIYLLCGGIQTIEMSDNLNDNYFIIEGEDVIPFIIYHNWCINHSMNLLHKNGKGGKSWSYLAVKNAYIENELNLNITIEDLAKKYINDLDLRLKLRHADLIDLSDEIYMHLIENILK